MPTHLADRVPPLRPGTCQVWWGRPENATDSMSRLLDDVELNRAAAYRRKVDADRFVVGCVLTRIVTGELSGMNPGRVRLDRHCPQCQKPHGRPRLPSDGLHLSVTHSGELVGVAVTAVAPVGIDVEARDADTGEVAAVMLGPEEQIHLDAVPAEARPEALLRYWVRKEAAVKATGDGLSADLAKVHVSAPDSPAELLRYPDRSEQDISLVDLDDDLADDDHLAALAVVAPRPPDVDAFDARRLLLSASVAV